MYFERILFPDGLPIAYEGCQIGSLHMHAHKDVIEILMVIRGKAKVTVSCENFVMDEGDYVVIRESDSHTISAIVSRCEIVSLYFDMSAYIGKIPYLYYVIFGCESFDLAKYRNETAKIRRMISSIISNLIQGSNTGTDEAVKCAENLLWILVNDYDMIKYYNRKWDTPFTKVEKYYKIMAYIFQDYHIKNLQEYISQKEHYSKSYVTHLFKEVGATSFKDMLGFVRVFRSEEILLNTDLSINEISDRCGFSDIKYYSAEFKKWFLCTASEYRKNALQEINKTSIFNELAPDLIVNRLGQLAKAESDETNYRASVNPISVKAFGFSAEDTRDIGYVNNLIQDSLSQKKDILPARKQRIQIKLTQNSLALNTIDFANYLKTYDDDKFLPILIVDLREMTLDEAWETIGRCLKIIGTKHPADYEIYINYSEIGDYEKIGSMVLKFQQEYGYSGLKPVFTSF